MVTDLRQVDRPLVAGPSPGALPHPQVGVGGDEPPPVEHGLPHDQRSVEGHLDHHAAGPESAVGGELVGEPPGLVPVLHAHDAARCRADGQFDVGREHLPRPEPIGLRHHRRRWLRESDPVEGPVRGHLVLHGGEGGEVRHDGGHPGRRQPVGTGRQHGHLLLGGEERIEAAGRPHRQGRVEPGERVRAVRGDAVEPADAPGEPGQGQRIGRQHLDLVPGLGQPSRRLPGRQARAVAEQDPHPPSLPGGLRSPRGAGSRR